MTGAPAPILIVGAGPTGLTLAHELARQGIEARLIEKAPAPSAQPKALGVLARTLEMLTASGVAHDMLAEGMRVPTFSIWSSGRCIGRLDFSEGVASRYPFTLMLPQPTTERILTEHLVRRGGALERGTELIGLTQHLEHVEVILRHGDGGEERTRASFVIGCDGAHSTVRHLVAVPFAGAAVAQRFATGVVRMHWGLPYDQALAFLHRGRLIAYFPLPGGLHQFLGVSSAGQVPDGQVTLEEIQQMVDECGPVGARATDAKELARYHVHQRRVARYVHGRVLLAGDAAHIHSPLGAQGMNTGMQDAMNLAWKLALVARGRAPLGLLETYQGERARVGAAKLLEDAALTRLGFLRHAWAVGARDMVTPGMMRYLPVRRRITDLATGLRISYPRGPLVVDDRRGRWPGAGAAIIAGERAPDGELTSPAVATPHRLYDLLPDTRHALLVFAPRCDARVRRDVLTAVAEWQDLLDPLWIARHGPAQGGEPIWCDRDGALAARYGIAEAGLVVIRPDGYVGFRSHHVVDTARLRRYLMAYHDRHGPVERLV